MILFLISFLCVFVSSYLLASVFAEKRYMTGLIYTMLIAFAQVIFTVEFLSLFGAVSKIGILIMNAVILAGIIYFWKKKDKPLYKPQFKEFWIKVFNAVKKDKMLAVMGLGFLFFIGISIFLCWIMPVIEYDALAYHFNRAIVWASQGSLAHFDIADDRNINMAVNSEILYTWFLTFVRRNLFIGFFSFAGYVLTMLSLYSFLEINGYCMRKRLWVVFLTSSLAGVLLEASGVEINIIMSGLILACVSLFLLGVKKGRIFPVYFSSLAISIAVGTKTTAFFVIPSLAVIFVYFLRTYQKEKFWYYTKMFLVFSILNTLVFSTYNYVLNFLDFGNSFGGESSMFYHSLKGGVKGYISGVIRHLFLLIDFTGFSYGFFIDKWIFALQNKILTFMHIPLDLNVISSNENMSNYMLNDSLVGGGIISLIVLLPCTIIAMVKGVFCRKCEKNKMLGLFGGSLYLCIAVMSMVIGFMLYSSRFLNTFLVLSAPVLVISYIRSNKNIFKYVILFYVMSYFCLISTHIWARHFLNIKKEFKKGQTITQVRNKHMCSTKLGFSGEMPYCILRNLIYQRFPKNSKIGVFTSIADNVAVIKLMENNGYVIDFLLTNKINHYDLKKYDYLIFTRLYPESSYVTNFNEILENYSVENGKIKFLDPKKPKCTLFNNSDKTILLMKNDMGKILTTSVSCDIPYEILAENGFYKVGRVVYGDVSTSKNKEKNSTEKAKSVSISTENTDALDEFSIFMRKKD